jgi:hypothetical protein
VHLKETLTIVLVPILLACSEPSTPFGDQTGTSGRRNPPELQGALHAPLGTNWADFDRALSTVNPWTGGHEQKRCSDKFACGFLLSKVKVQIQANPESMFADSTNVGTNGTILIKLVNTGDRPTAKYDLNASPMEYYVVVKHTNPAAWQWAFVEKGGTAPPRVRAWHDFNACEPHPHDTPTKSVANFQRCGDPYPEAVKRASFLALTEVWSSLTQALEFELEAPGWISCAYGCCTLLY